MNLLDLKLYEEEIKSIYWGQIYNNTISNSNWLKNKSISPGRWAVGYEFLYVLYRILDESKIKNILELGLGQSTKITSQYASFYNAHHIVIEHDKHWIDFIKNAWMDNITSTIIKQTDIEISCLKGNKYYRYKNFHKLLERKYNLIIIDGPWGGDGDVSRIDVLERLPNILENDFVIMLDDCGRVGEWNTFQAMADALKDIGVEISTGIYDGGGYKKTAIITSKSLKWFTTL